MESHSKDKPLNSERVKKITEAVLSLPVLPTITAKLLQLVDHPDTSAALLSNLVSKDQVLTAKILKMANSSFYGFSREINTVQKAVVILGFNNLREISLSMSVFNAFKSEQNNKYFSISEFWKHSIGVGLCARMLAADISFSDANEAFTSGLLHDIGKIVLNQYLPFEFMKCQKMVYEEDMDLEEAEEKVFSVHHAQVGSWLANRWKLPPKMVDIIEFHHEPWKSKDFEPHCWLIFLSDYITIKAKIGASGRKTLRPLTENELQMIEAKLGITEADILKYQTDLKNEFNEKASDLVGEVN